MEASQSPCIYDRHHLEQLRSHADRLHVLATSNRWHALEKSLNALRIRIDYRLPSIAVIGEFKRGKSTFINALLGRALLPMDVNPATAVATRIRPSGQPGAFVRFHDGRDEPIAFHQLAHYVTQLTEYGQAQVALVKEAFVDYPLPVCQYHLTEFIDTPGLNDTEEITVRTVAALEDCDAVIMVISAQTPFAQTERDFLTNHLLAAGFRHFLFVVNCIDLFGCTSDADRVVDFIARRVEGHIAEWATQENQAAPKPRVYGLSAELALRGKETGNQRLLEQSRFTVFEAGLRAWLARHGEAIRVHSISQRLFRFAGELLAELQAAERCLNEERNSANRRFSHAVAEIARLRGGVKRATDTLNCTRANLSGLIRHAPARLESEIKAAVHHVLERELADMSEFKTDAAKFQTALANQIDTTVDTAILQQAQNLLTNSDRAIQEAAELFFQAIQPRFSDMEPNRLLGREIVERLSRIELQPTNGTLGEYIGKPCQPSVSSPLRRLVLSTPNTFVFEVDDSDLGGMVVWGTLGSILSLGWGTGAGIALGKMMSADQRANKFRDTYPNRVMSQIEQAVRQPSTHEVIASWFSSYTTLLYRWEDATRGIFDFLSQAEVDLTGEHNRQDKHLQSRISQLRVWLHEVHGILQETQGLADALIATNEE